MVPLLCRSFRLKTTLKLSLLMKLLEGTRHAITLELESVQKEQLLSLCKSVTVTAQPRQNKREEDLSHHVSGTGLRP